MTELCLLKLGGSLITDKRTPYTPRQAVLARLAGEIARAVEARPHLNLIIGHGSGSFGHTPAKQYGTRSGVHTQEQWHGFVDVWKEARALNQIVLDALLSAGLPVIALPPSASVIAVNGEIKSWALAPIQSALAHGLIPLINGDVIFDEVRGGTILSTEDLFFHLARVLKPRQILLAGLEDGVWEDYPACTRLINTITPGSFSRVFPHLGQSAGVDVTGGMVQKVSSMVDLIREQPGLKALIFSGEQPGLLQQVLQGARAGTVILQEEM